MENISRRWITRYKTTDMRDFLNKLRDRAWNCMSKTDWEDTLYKLNHAQYGNQDESGVEESILSTNHLMNLLMKIPMNS